MSTSGADVIQVTGSNSFSGSTVQRFPNGIEQKGFWQKDLPGHAPPWITRWTYDHGDDGPKDYAVVDSAATLAWLAQEAAMELHPWTSPIDAPTSTRPA